MNMKFFKNYPFGKEFIFIELSITETARCKHYTMAFLGFGIVVTRWTGDK